MARRDRVDAAPVSLYLRRKEQQRLLWLERRKARQVKGSKRYRATCQKIARTHQRAGNRRHDFAHKVSGDLAKNTAWSPSRSCG